MRRVSAAALRPLARSSACAETEFDWDDIITLGGTGAGYAYLAAADGRRVLWTDMHNGHDRLFAAIQRRRPDLITPAMQPADPDSDYDLRD